MVELNGKLSIIMPAYNEEKLIYHSLISTLDIVGEFVSDFEIVAVNDGSRDNTLKEMKRAADTDSRIRIISSEKNRGKGNPL